MSSPSQNLLLIFTRNPELGKVKTRLAKGIGAQNALKVYIQLLEHTKSVVLSAPCDKRVGYSEMVRHNDIWNDAEFQKFKQQGTDLGDRMYHAFAKAFSERYQKVIIIGSDLYDLREQHISEAFTALDTHEVVIGPAQDGGYYLLGMKQLHKAVFYNKLWGSEAVYKDTLNDLTDQKLYLLPTLNDIDHMEDLAGYDEFKTYIPNLKKV